MTETGNVEIKKIEEMLRVLLKNEMDEGLKKLATKSEMDEGLKKLATKDDLEMLEKRIKYDLTMLEKRIEFNERRIDSWANLPPILPNMGSQSRPQTTSTHSVSKARWSKTSIYG